MEDFHVLSTEEVNALINKFTEKTYEGKINWVRHQDHYFYDFTHQSFHGEHVEKALMELNTAIVNQFNKVIKEAIKSLNVL
jgi:hypothetical protein